MANEHAKCLKSLGINISSVISSNGSKTVDEFMSTYNIEHKCYLSHAGTCGPCPSLTPQSEVLLPWDYMQSVSHVLCSAQVYGSDAVFQLPDPFRTYMCFGISWINVLGKSLEPLFTAYGDLSRC